jgi:glycosyltransferase involved in cell wall biosynthesis
MILIEYSPDAALTGILRVTLQIIRAISNYTDLYLVVGLQHPDYKIPRTCKVKFVSKESIKSVFDEELVQEIANLPVNDISLKEIEKFSIFYPRWRPSKRYFSKEIGIIHDCSPITRSIDFQNPDSGYFRKHLELSSKNNDLTFTVSDFTKAEVQAQVTFPVGKLVRIYPGPSFDPRKLREATNSPKKARNAYCLYVGSLDPRKGILELLTWWQANGDESKYENLLLVGTIPKWASNNHQAKIERALSTTKNIKYLGRQPDSIVFELLTKASLCLYPSKYEGFGLPVCDALFAGVNVVTSNQTSTMEFKDAGAFLVDPEKPWQWNSIIGTQTKKAIPVDKLLKKYDWLNYAKEILSL